ncbi:MAG: hypothetical protein ACRC80_27135, partial [Waterburya sp.]
MTTQLETQQLCQTEKLLKNIRKTPLFMQLIPQEAGVGLPIPLRRNNKVYALLPCFGFKPVEKGKTLLFPPFAKITVQWSNQLPVEYVNLHFNNPAPELQWSGEIGTYPHDAVAEMTIGEYKAKRQELMQMYDEMFAALENSSGLSPDFKQQFSDLFSTLIEPPLIPYYQVFGEKFCQNFLV